MRENPKNLYPLEQPEALWTRPFIVLTVSYFMMFLCLQMLLSPFPSYVKDRFDPGNFTLSLVTSLFAFTAILSRFATAAVMARLNRTALLYAGIAIMGLATVCYPFADSVAAVLALRVLFGIGFGMGSTIMPTIVSRILPSRRMGEGIGYFGLSTSMAMSVGPIIGLSLLDGYGFTTLSIWGAAASVLVLPLLLATRAIPVQRGPGGSDKLPSGSNAEIHAVHSREQHQKAAAFRISKLILPVTLNTMMSACYGGLLGFLVLYGREIGIANIGLFFLFNAITVLIVRPISGKLYDKRGHAVVLIPAALLLVASLTVLSYTQHFGMLVCSALLFGLGYGAIQPTIQAWMLGGAPREKHGVINSFFYNSIDLGVALGSMLLGVIASATGYAVMYRYSAGLMGLFLLLYILVRYSNRQTPVRMAALPSEVESA